jgi:hypothetical protein
MSFGEILTYSCRFLKLISSTSLKLVLSSLHKEWSIAVLNLPITMWFLTECPWFQPTEEKDLNFEVNVLLTLP